MEASSRVALTWSAQICQGLATIILSWSCSVIAAPNTLQGDTQKALLELTHIDAKQAQCVTFVARGYQVPVDIILSILAIEKGKVGKKSTNNNGTYDHGPAQINTVRMGEIKHFIQSPAELQNDECTNIMALGYLLHKHIYVEKMPFWTAVGSYHYRNTGANPRHHYDYIYKVAIKRGQICEKYKAICSQTN